MKKKTKSVLLREFIKGKCFSICKLLTLILLLLVLCQCKTLLAPEKQNPPKGIGWTTYNQSYNYTSADMYTSVNYGSYYNTYTQSTDYYSEVKPNEGSALFPPEIPQTKGSPQIQKCNYIFTKAKGENK